ncbi:MAG: YidC/Oxa1 family membrane protein insertase [Firmicutes bacterium]|nr:YidC/Oxa1 family membrane protein insertase [Bacillota bacterium]
MKIVLAATTNWLLKPFALLLSLIFNGLFAVISGWTTSQALAITIVLFTLIVRLAMMPLMLNQQRSSRRMTRLQPKVQKIQEKYKNKKDPESNQRMQAEIQELYKQNKANPMSGCLPLLIQMPIIFALFEVLRNVPFYVNTIGNLYENLATIVQGQSGYGDILTTNFSTVINGLRKFDVTMNTSVMDLLYHLSRTQWKELIETFGLASNAEFIKDYELVTEYNTFGITSVEALTFNLSEAPGWKGWGILFPLISGGTTFLQSWLSQAATEKRQKMASPDGIADTSQQSMKMMTYVFPIMTLFFTAQMPLGLGLYWIAGNIFAIFSQIISDAIIDREEYKEAVKRRDELAAKKAAQANSKSKVDKATGGRLGAVSNAQSKAALSGNKRAALNQQAKQAAALPAEAKEDVVSEIVEEAPEVIENEIAEEVSAAEETFETVEETVTEVAEAAEETAEDVTEALDDVQKEEVSE